MSVKRKPKHFGILLMRTAAASAAGILFMLSIMALGSLLLLKGSAGERGMDICLITAVFMGSVLSALLTRKHVPGVIPGVLLTSVGFALMLYFLSFAAAGETVHPMLNFKIGLSSVLGCTFGIVTNLVKSNKSYINKSKRKPMITHS